MKDRLKITSIAPGWGAFRSARFAAACAAGMWSTAGAAWASPTEIGPGMLSEIVLFPAIFATVAFLIWVLASHMQQHARMRMQLELRLKILERLSSAADVAALLSGEKGAQMMRELMGEERPDLSHRIIGTVRSGIIVAATGVGFSLLAALNTLGGGAVFAAFAILLLALGGGFLAAAFVAWRLGASLGLAGATGSQEATKPQPR